MNGLGAKLSDFRIQPITFNFGCLQATEKFTFKSDHCFDSQSRELGQRTEIYFSLKAVNSRFNRQYVRLFFGQGRISIMF